MTAPQATLYTALFKGGWQDSENMEVVQKFQAGTSISFPGTYTAQHGHFMTCSMPFPAQTQTPVPAKPNSSRIIFKAGHMD